MAVLLEKGLGEGPGHPSWGRVGDRAESSPQTRLRRGFFTVTLTGRLPGGPIPSSSPIHNS